MLKKLYISQIISYLAVTKPLSAIVIGMHNFIAKFRNILEVCKKFAGNQVNEKGNVPRRGVVPTFSDLEVVALSITAEAFSIDSENYLFNRLNKECPSAIPNLITRRQFNQRRKLTCRPKYRPSQCCSISILSIIGPSGKLNMHYFNSTNE